MTGNNHFATTPINGALGIEITGVDLENLDVETIRKIKDAYREHIVLVFPDQDLSPAQQMAFTEIFGPPRPHPLRTRASVEGHPEVLILENRPGQPGAPNDYWHSDISHAEDPPSASILHALIIPQGHSDTMFCNMVRAYDNLSDTMKGMIEGLQALHSGMATYTRSLGHSDARKIDPKEIKPPRAHPVVREPEGTGQKALFVNPHFTTGLVDVPDDQSGWLLNQLYQVATKPENVYRHRWRVGDVVVWDNRRAMHYAVRDYTEDMPRKLHRTTAAGEIPV